MAHELKLPLPATPRPPARAARAGVAWQRLPLLALGLIALVLGLSGGLARLGLGAPVPAAAGAHGPLMLLGFFGVLIALERAVALGALWGYAVPLLAGAGSAALLLGGPAPALFAASAVGMLVLTTWLWARQPEPHAALLVAGAASQLLGSLGWALGFVFGATLPAWLGFLVLTIAAERLELSRLRPRGPAAQAAFWWLASACALGCAAALFEAPWALPLLGASLLGLAVWLLRHDIARHTVRTAGLTRYVAICLLSGYAWLALAGALIARHGLPAGTWVYDAALHALLLGFVFAMVFGHAPLIGPALLRIRLPFHPSQYLPLVLLHASLALRLAGDAAAEQALRQAGAWGSVAAIALFIALLIWRATRRPS
ncbi:hypothetical protein [Inhella proteolytica]|uniref:NnrS family protein n=1 Tax=Inhella proteolytica TaxID=2795029 RepID=A0A931NGF6_9BURK|nr:hypothetical protein [Inhella proteolytica]MBH9577096.1 hypothetical protein [Inhella proteolytica]